MLEAYSKSELVEQALAEAQARMPAAVEQLKMQLAAVEAEIRKTEEALERYFLAFEAGTMNQTPCTSRIEVLTKRLSDLRCDRVGLQNAIDLG